jgi:alcohol dehydrogenase (cytochrome c)
VCNDLTSTPTEASEGRFHANGAFSFKLPPDRKTFSHLDAWDPITRKRVWSMPYRYVLLASVLATAGDLVFSGNPEGDFFALDARSGNKLWS